MRDVWEDGGKIAQPFVEWRDKAERLFGELGKALKASGDAAQEEFRKIIKETIDSHPPYVSVRDGRLVIRIYDSELNHMNEVDLAAALKECVDDYEQEGLGALRLLLGEIADLDNKPHP